ncbi:MAG: hypothetical protein ACTHLO_03030 [Pseudolabrys sp.]
MPTHTPRKPQARARAAEPVEQVDWLALWAISLGLCAVVLAAIAYFTVGDKLGASTIMASVAGVIGAVLHMSQPPVEDR